MGLNKSKGNMFGWLTHTHTHLRGECQHGCSYCYMKAIRRIHKGGIYAGPICLTEAELEVDYGSGKTIFIENCNDLFANNVPDEWVYRILGHCKQYPDNTYVFHTKNPWRMGRFVRDMPERKLLGATVESDDAYADLYKGPVYPPDMQARIAAVAELVDVPRFITVEPILYMDNPETFAMAIAAAVGEDGFINVGADSKGTGLIEPSRPELERFMAALKRTGVRIERTHNLERLLRGKARK